MTRAPSGAGSSALTRVPVRTVMPRAAYAWVRPALTAGSALAISDAAASKTVTRTPKSARMEAIWQPVSAPPMTAASAGRLVSDGMSL